MGAVFLMESRHSPVKGVLRRGREGSHRGFMLDGGVQVAEKREFRHTILGNRQFGVI